MSKDKKRKEPTVPLQSNLNAIKLRDALWETLNKVKDGELTPGSADAVASQAREILRTVRTQLAIFSQASIAVTGELIDFAKPKE